MFYSSEILTVKSSSRLGIVWIAATLGPKSGTKRLSRRELNGLNIADACRYMATPPEPLSLRLQANLMVGVSRVYGAQCSYHYGDVQSTCTQISNIIKTAASNSEGDAARKNVDMDPAQSTAANNTITLKKIDCISAINVLPSTDMDLPDLDIATLLKSDALPFDKGNINRNLMTSSSGIFATPEIGRRGFSSSAYGSSASKLCTPFHSDYYNGDGGIDYDTASDVKTGSMPSLFAFHMYKQPNPLFSDILPAQSLKNRKSKSRSLNLFDEKLVLNKNELFLSDQHEPNIVKFLQSTSNDARTLALSLLNGFSCVEAQDQFIALCPMVTDLFPKSDSRDSNDSFDDEVAVSEIEAYRGRTDHFDIDEITSIASGPSMVATPRALNMPWTSSSELESVKSTGSSMSTKSSSSALNSTPLGRRAPPFPEMLDSLKLSSTASSPAESTSLASSAITCIKSAELLDFYYYLQEAVLSRFHGRSLNFHALFPEKETARGIVSRAFAHLLELRNDGLISIQQSRPQGSIKIDPFA